MTLDEKVARAKTDYDEVFEAGYAKGQAEGGGGGISNLALLLSDELEEATETDLQGVTNIPPYMFALHKNLKKIHFPSSVVNIVGCTFRDNAYIEEITMKDSVTVLGGTAYDYVFYKCRKLTSIEISANVTKIYGSCFRQCEALKRIVFRGNVTNFYSYNIFAEDRNLEEIDLRNCTEPPTLAATSSFDNTGKNVGGTKIYVKTGLKSAFENATNWSSLTNVTFIEV